MCKNHSAIKAVGNYVLISNHDETKESVKNVHQVTDDLEKQGHIIAHKHEQEVAKLHRKIKALQSRERFLLKRNTEIRSEASALKRSIFDDNSTWLLHQLHLPLQRPPSFLLTRLHLYHIQLHQHFPKKKASYWPSPKRSS